MADDQPVQAPVSVCDDNGCTAPWASKTLWASVIVALAPLFPPVQALIVANPAIVTAGVAAVFALLRTFSGRKVPVVGSSGKPIGLK